MELFSSEDITKALVQLGIAFETRGKCVAAASFKSLRKIEPAGIYFVESSSRDDLHASVILIKDYTGFSDDNFLIKLKYPQLAFYKLMQYFLGPKPRETSIHATAIIDPEATISAGVVIGPYCVLGKCSIGENVTLTSHIVIMDNVAIGENTVIEPHSTIGATGVAWIWDPETGERIVEPQTGGVVIGKNCFLGSDITVVRGSVNEATAIGDGCVIAHGSKIAHGCVIGPNSHLANNVTLAGNVTTGERCFFGAASVVRPMVRLAQNTTVGAGAVVVSSFYEPDLLLMGVPAKASPKNNVKLTGVPSIPPSGD